MQAHAKYFSKSDTTDWYPTVVEGSQSSSEKRLGPRLVPEKDLSQSGDYQGPHYVHSAAFGHVIKWKSSRDFHLLLRCLTTKVRRTSLTPPPPFSPTAHACL